MTAEQRKRVIAELRTWIGTPYRGHQCVKGAGVDCGQLIYGVYRACGLIPEVDLPRDYSLDATFHQASTEYVSIVDRFFVPTADPQPGDLVLYRIGKAYGHGGIIERWPELVIQAEISHGVSGTHGLRNPGLRRNRYLHGAEVIFRTLRGE